MTKLATSLWQHSLIGLLCISIVMSPLIVTTGCSTGQVSTVVTDVTKFAPVIVNVLNLACAFKPSETLCSTGTAKLNTDIADLEKALNDWNAAVAAGGANISVWTALNATFTTFEQDSAAIFQLFQISGAGSQSTAMDVVASALTLLSVIEAVFPAAPPVAAATAERAVRAHAFADLSVKTGTPVAAVKFFNLKAWQKDYNKKVSAAQKKNPTAKLAQVKVV